MSTFVTLFSILLTIGAYMVSRIVARKYPSPFTTPVFFSTALIIIVLLILGLSFEQYEPGKEIMTFFLGPATVALAVPLYKNRQLVVTYSVPAAAGIVIGALATTLSAVFIGLLFHLPHDVLASLGVKSVTVPIALEITALTGGNPTLSAAFVVLTGTLGTMIGPWLLKRSGITSPFAYGLAMGVVSHGQGTAQAATENELAGAVAGVAMGLTAIVTSIILPTLMPYIT
ncbi:putative murein hydrolase (TIGR00659 family) [Aneurinibacillus soli]|uniref:Holin-like protein CidB n=1 Tax=Aneurinibacillus soli TaxID=1500254 RepID=A0A0U5C787_9BACL|nr:LrgB family protein [Aneurinibacillus soli]PYE64102.1 putative murein hydrolase (TIGR00659 family) [Aneurinibacillus soli]BAU28051.1 Holin-like protein CidB [Aneurinibacillus soli]